MGANTGIEWTDSTWTPIRARYWEIQSDGNGKERIGWHCEHVSEACRFCYAESFNRRLGTGQDFKPGALFRESKVGYNNGEVKLFLDEKMLTAPLRWKRPRKIFVCSMTDLFADFVPDEFIVRMFAIMALTPRHTYQILTKRPERMRDFVTEERGRAIKGCAWEMLGRLPKYEHGGIQNRPWPLPNVWLGTSVEDQTLADECRESMRALAALGWLTWVSYEPALGPVDWTGWEFLKWIVSGGESGVGARPSHPDWHRRTRDFCAANGTAYLFKQWGAWRHAPDRAHFKELIDESWMRLESGITGTRPAFMVREGKKAAGRLLDGVEHNGMPR